MADDDNNGGPGSFGYTSFGNEIDWAHREALVEVDKLGPAAPKVGDPNWNPLFEIWKKYNDEAFIEDRNNWFMRTDVRIGFEGIKARFAMCPRYAWAVPHPASLDAIAAHGPIIEIGAGAGYWAMLLRLRGVDIICFDLEPPNSADHKNHYFEGTVATFAPVHVGGPEKIADHPDRTLFLCWPPYNDPMAFDCLQVYRGERLLLIGERGGCTGDDAFEEALGADWDEERGVAIPQWYGIHDVLTIYRRKATP